MAKRKKVSGIGALQNSNARLRKQISDVKKKEREVKRKKKLMALNASLKRKLSSTKRSKKRR